MNAYQKLLNSSSRKLLKALQHLNYSFKKIEQLGIKVSDLDEETLETWESFAARFSRVVEIFLMRYLRVYVLSHDPGFEGSLRDFVNQAEKLGLIDNAHRWMEIRALRNITAHDYSESDLSRFFEQLKQEAPYLLQLKELLGKSPCV